MKCERCGGKTEVDETRDCGTDGKIVRRRRICKECGYRYITFEFSLEQISKEHPEIIVYKGPQRKRNRKENVPLEGQITVEEYLEERA